VQQHLRTLCIVDPEAHQSLPQRACRNRAGDRPVLALDPVGNGMHVVHCQLRKEGPRCASSPLFSLPRTSQSGSPRFCVARSKLADTYTMSKRVDKKKAGELLAAFFAICSSSADQGAQVRVEPGGQHRAAGACGGRTARAPRPGGGSEVRLAMEPDRLPRFGCGVGRDNGRQARIDYAACVTRRYS
jgi:hypothetical protein